MTTPTGFTGASSQYDYMVPVWKLAQRNNAKAKVITRRQSKSDAHHMVYWG